MCPRNGLAVWQQPRQQEPPRYQIARCRPSLYANLILYLVFDNQSSAEIASALHRFQRHGLRAAYRDMSKLRMFFMHEHATYDPSQLLTLECPPMLRSPARNYCGLVHQHGDWHVYTYLLSPQRAASHRTKHLRIAESTSCRTRSHPQS